MRTKGVVSTYTSLAMVILSVNLVAATADSKTCVTGVADLSEVHFIDHGSIPLLGEWKFYRHAFLPPLTVKDSFELIAVPSSWSYLPGMPLFDYGTYVLEILLPKDSEPLAIYLPSITGAAKLWVNGHLIVSRGNVSANEKDYRGAIGHYFIHLPTGVQQINVTIHVANFRFPGSGITAIPMIGLTSALDQSISIDKAFGNIFAGSLLAIAVIHLILFQLYKKESAYLYLALICICISVRAFLLGRGSLFASDLFPNVEAEYFKKVEFFCVYLLLILFPKYVASTFPSRCPQPPVDAFTVIGIFFCAAAILAPMTLFIGLLDYAHILFIIEFAFAAYIFFRNRKNTDTRIILIGIGASFPLILIEMMANSGLFYLPVNHLVELGVLAFFLFQALLLARKNARAFFTAENLNRKLEVMVRERTEELSQSNQVKDSLLSILSHDLKSPINTLKGVLHLFNHQYITEGELRPRMEELEKNVSNTSLLLENVLKWSSSQTTGITIHKVRLDMFTIVEEHVAIFGQQAKLKNITIMNAIHPCTKVTADENVISLVLRNLINNAIKFTPPGGRISIMTVDNGSKLDLLVKDTGVGMDEHVVKQLFTEAAKSRNGTSNEKGHGLGLSLCHKFLKEMGATISIKSIPNVGTTFIVSLEKCESQPVLN